MARFKSATWRPVSGHTDGPMTAHVGVVLHVNESNGNLYNWVAGDHNMSCHFEVYKDGSAEQYIDTADSSWCQMDGNATYISVETEGFATEPLTAAQLRKVAEIVAEAHTVHGIPLQLADTPGQAGFGWHGMGGAAWGGHTGCPGDQRKAQRAAILTLAQALVNDKTSAAVAVTAPSKEVDVILAHNTNNKVHPLLVTGGKAVVITEAKTVQNLLAAGVQRVAVEPADYDRLRKLA